MMSSATSAALLDMAFCLDKYKLVGLFRRDFTHMFNVYHQIWQKFKLIQWIEVCALFYKKIAQDFIFRFRSVPHESKKNLIKTFFYRK